MEKVVQKFKVEMGAMSTKNKATMPLENTATKAEMRGLEVAIYDLGKTSPTILWVMGISLVVLTAMPKVVYHLK